MIVILYRTFKELGRVKPTRKGISLISQDGERAITVIGERLQPIASDNLPWDDMQNYDGILGGGLGAALSRGDGRWWAIPLGVVGGSMIGCDIDGG